MGAAAVHVPVRIVNESDIPLTGQAISFGMPLPKGVLYDPAPLVVADTRGRLPLQTRVLAAWPDGSVQWLLITTRVDLPGSGEISILVSAVDGEESTTSMEPGWEVDAGPDRDRPRIFDGERVVEAAAASPTDVADDPVLFLFTAGDGGAVPVRLLYRPAEDSGGPSHFGAWSFQLEESGPLRAVVGFEGRAGDGALLRIRGTLTVHAGDPLACLRYRLVNEGAEPVNLGLVRLQVGDAGVRTTSVEAAGAHQTTAEDSADDAFTRTDTTVGGVAAGFRMALTQTWFRERFPHRVAIGASGAEADLATPAGPPLTLGPGVGVEDEVWIAFGGDDLDPASILPRLEVMASRRPVAVVDPAWVASSGALGTLAVAGPETAAYDASVDRFLQLLEEDRERSGAYGTLNFGDWIFGNGEWGNIEYDLAHAMFLQFARTGDVRYFRRGEEAAVHFMNVDVRHAWDADPDLVGLPHGHSVGHTSSHGGLHHTWLQGVLEYGLLTGNTDAIDVARSVGDWICREMDARSMLQDASPREPGWALLALTSLYRATADRKYLEACDRVFNMMYAARDDDGLLRYPTDCPEDGVLRATKPFMMGIVFEGLWEYAHICGDPRIGEFVVKAVDSMIEKMWIPEHGGFLYTDCPKEEYRGRASDVRELTGLAFAWAITGEGRHLDVARTNLEAGIAAAMKRSEVNGKAVGIHTRATPRYLAIVEKGRDAARKELALIDPERDRFEVRGWQAHYPDMDRLRRAIPMAAEQGINHFQISHHIVHDAEDLLNNPERQDQVRELARLCHRHGIQIFSWTHELNAVPDRFRRDGKVDLDDEALWDWVREKYRRFFELAPELDGLILTFHETDVPVYYDDRVLSSLSHPQRVTKLIDAIHDVCRALDKTLYVRTFIYRAEELGWVIEGIQACDPAVCVMSKCEPHDWHPYYPHNPALGRFPGRLQVVEVDLGCEYYGQSRVPYALHRYLRYRLDYALEAGARGAVTRIGRNANSILETPNELNLAVYARLLDDPYASADDLWREAIAARYGAAATELEPALTATWDIVNRVWLTQGFYFLNNHSAVPSLSYARSHVGSHSVGKWDRRFRAMEERLARPDPDLARNAMLEKAIAIEEARKALVRVQGCLARVPEGRRDELRRSFEQLDWCARLWARLADAYFAAGLWRVAPSEDRAQDVRRGVAALRGFSESVEDALGPDAQWASANLSRRFADAIETELEK